jgi:hypothetical protein
VLGVCPECPGGGRVRSKSKGKGRDVVGGPQARRVIFAACLLVGVTFLEPLVTMPSLESS